MEDNMKYEIRKKAAALMMSAIMLLQLLPLSGLAKSFDTTTESFSLAGRSALAAANDGGSIGNVDTGGAEAEISVGGSVTITTVNMRSLFSNTNNSSRFSYTLTPTNSQYVEPSSTSGNGLKRDESITITFEGLQPGVQSFNLKISRTRWSTVTIPLTITVSEPMGTVNFMNRGQTIHSINVLLGAKIGSAMHADLVEEGFIFEGWYTTAGKKITANTIVNQNIDAHARWRITLSFDTNGGDAIEPITPIENQPVGALPIPVKNGYAFEGWYADAALTIPVTSTSSFAANTTLYAKWTSTGHLVNYYSYDGHFVLATYLVSDGAYIDPMSPPAPAAGYGFRGWYTAAYPDGTLFDFTQPITGPTNIYAHQAPLYVVSFSTSGSYVPVQQVFAGEKAVEPEQNPTREGYTFVRWSLVENGTQAYDFNTPVTANTKIYAVWTPKTDIKFQVLYWYQNAAPNAAERADSFVRGYTPGEMVEYNNGISGGTLKVVTTGSTHSLVVSSGEVDTPLGTVPHKQHTYFAYEKYQLNVTISGTGTTVFNIYYDRIPYTLTFDLNNDGVNGRLTVGNTTYTGTNYKITARYNDYISDLWPLNENVKDPTNTSSFNGWSYPGSSSLQTSHVYNLTSNFIDDAGNAGKTLTSEWTTGAYHYFLIYMFESLDGTTPHGSLGTHEYSAPIGVKNHKIASSYMEYTKYGSDVKFGHKTITGMNGNDTDRKTFENPNSSSDAYNLLSQSLKDIYDGISSAEQSRRRIQILYYYRNRGNVVFNTMGVSVPGIEEHNQSWTNIMYEADISGSKPTCISEGEIIGNRRFEGWYTGPDYITEFNFVGAKMPFVANEGNVYIYAKWSPLDYRVEYYLSRTATDFWEDDGIEEGGYANQLTPTSPDPEHDEFLAWYWNNPDTGAFEPFAFETPFTEDSTDENGVIKLYAVWDISGLEVFYKRNAEDATGEEPDDDNKYAAGTIVTVKDRNTLARENYLFGGWSTKEIGPAMYQPGETFVITEDTTLYAVWIPLVNVTVTKVWDDNSDQDGLRPAKLLLVLNGSDGSSRQYELSGTENTWSHTFDNLPEKYQGQTIVYTVDEVTVPSGYTKTVDQATLTVTNTHTPATISKTVSKVWVDNDNQDGLRTDVTLKLTATAGGSEVDWADLVSASASGTQMDADGEVTLSGGSHTFDNLPEKYQGQTIVYTVDEVTVPSGYTKTVDQATLTVTNTHTPGTTERTVTKVWADNDNQDGLRTAVELQLVAKVNDVEVPWADLKAASASSSGMDDDGLVTIGIAEPFSYKFENLPEKYQGKDVVYTVNEPTVPTGYTESYDQDTLTVTNTHTPATISKTVSKVWVDNDNQDGLRTDVTLKLTATAGGSEVDWADLVSASASGTQMDADGEVTLSGGSHTFDNLPEKYQGKDVVYTVDEVTIPSGYTKTVDQATLTVTNTHTPGTTERTVTKVWADNDNQDGLRTDVTLKLTATAGGSEVDWAEVDWADLVSASASGTQMDADGEVTLSGGSHTFDNLPEKYRGQTIVYTVDEVTVPFGYTKTVDQATLTVTNTHTPGTTERTVTKVWADNDNQDGLRTDVTLKLTATAGGSEVDWAEVDWADLVSASASGTQMDADGEVTLSGGSHTFDNLPEKYQGQTIVYTVDEVTVPSGYTKTVDQATLTVTNTHTPGTTERTVTKVWADNDNQDGLRTAVELQLVAKVNDVEVPWADLKAASASSSGMDDDGLVTIGIAEPFSYKFENLPEKYQGSDVVYSVLEQTDLTGLGYLAPTYSTDGLTVTNTYTPGTTERTVTKVWADNNNQDGLRTDVTLKLTATAGGSEVDWADLVSASASGTQMDADGEVTLSGGSHTFDNLPEKYQGQTIVYTVDEVTVPSGYTKTVDQATLTVTNTHTPGTTERTVTKVWADNDNQDGLRTAVELQLVAKVNDVEVPWADLKAASASSSGMDDDGLVTIGIAEPFSYKFENLPEKYQGSDVVYSVLEQTDLTGLGYLAPTYSTDGLTVTNTYTPGTTERTVTKVWADNNNQDGLRTDVTLKLTATAGGSEVDWADLVSASASGTQMDADGEVTLSGGSHTFDNLPEKYQGQTIVYTVDEVTVPSGYTKTVDQATLTVTNTHTPGTTERTVTKMWADNDNQDGLRTAVELQLVAKVNDVEVPWADLKAASASSSGMDDDGLVTIGIAEPFSYKFENLPEKYQGSDVVYSVLEQTDLTGLGYLAPTYSTDGLTVTNTYTPGTTERTVTKVWADNNNQDGLRTDVTLKLTATAGGSEVDWADLVSASASGTQMDADGEVTLSGGSHTFDNLPEKYQGQTIVYTVDEVTVPSGYTKTVDQATLTVTNTHTPGTTERTVTKVWADNDNQDGLRTAVELQLVAKVNDVEVPWADLKAASASSSGMDDDGLVTIGIAEPFSYKFENLPEKYQGSDVVYSVLEQTDLTGLGYLAPTYSTDGLTVTNTYTPGTTERTVTKVWADNNNQDGLRTDVTLKLTATAGGSEVDWADLVSASASGTQMDADGEVTLSGGSHTFDNLPEKYQGQTIVYTVDEVTGYLPDRTPRPLIKRR
jgi:uncharacterized repeat protein (TIGR02543 family)